MNTIYSQQQLYNTDKNPALNKTSSSYSQQQTSYMKHKRPSIKDQLLDDDDSLASSSSDESIIDEPPTTNHVDCYHVSTEHKFWQAHSSMTIIAPPMVSSNSYHRSSFPMKKKQPTLAVQVKQILGTTFDETDSEIEAEWNKSRTKLSSVLNN
ncbi:uncharacterized protein BX663DRAFT_514081 [Cokeromyces recurvatus]|uniref:uncharacterized protein n=1 Tax=Cokeromyces recurvatus TaxID=90255 RepID=UPI00222047B9|nr:uncharacterized protein BX663DRAFT_514081 [Cokeromyces recurvatus]KAI7901312.1 hypothetical protein BX663DRAFT_514081 [Cokeromyces recurvatus]